MAWIPSPESGGEGGGRESRADLLRAALLGYLPLASDPDRLGRGLEQLGAAYRYPFQRMQDLAPWVGKAERAAGEGIGNLGDLSEPAMGFLGQALAGVGGAVGPHIGPALETVGRTPIGAGAGKALEFMAGPGAGPGAGGMRYGLGTEQIQRELAEDQERYDTLVLRWQEGSLTEGEQEELDALEQRMNEYRGQDKFAAAERHPDYMKGEVVSGLGQGAVATVLAPSIGSGWLRNLVAGGLDPGGQAASVGIEAAGRGTGALAKALRGVEPPEGVALTPEAHGFVATPGGPGPLPGAARGAVGGAGMQGYAESQQDGATPESILRAALGGVALGGTYGGGGNALRRALAGEGSPDLLALAGRRLSPAAQRAAGQAEMGMEGLPEGVRPGTIAGEPIMPREEMVANLAKANERIATSKDPSEIAKLTSMRDFYEQSLFGGSVNAAIPDPAVLARAKEAGYELPAAPPVTPPRPGARKPAPRLPEGEPVLDRPTLFVKQYQDPVDGKWRWSVVDREGTQIEGKLASRDVAEKRRNALTQQGATRTVEQAPPAAAEAPSGRPPTAPPSETLFGPATPPREMGGVRLRPGFEPPKPPTNESAAGLLDRPQYEGLRPGEEPSAAQKMRAAGQPEMFAESRPTYHVAVEGGDEAHIPAKGGMRVEVPGLEGREIFASKDERGKWVIADAQSGLALSEPAWTRAEAVAQVAARVAEAGAENVERQLESAARRYGVAPGWKDRLNIETVHSLDITPEMGGVAKDQGFPLFPALAPPVAIGAAEAARRQRGEQDRQPDLVGSVR